MAAAIARIAKISTGMNQTCSWFLKELNNTTGPRKESGKAPARYLRPFMSCGLLVCFISVKIQRY